MEELLEKLKRWRKFAADREGIEIFRVVSNKTLEELVEKKPTTKEELLLINGIKEKKFEKYGFELLKIMRDKDSDIIKEEVEVKNKVYTISEYLGFLNNEFLKYQSRVKGEVSSFKIQGSAIYFSIKDSQRDGVMDCFMWVRNYELCGVEIEVGMEIVVDGAPSIYAVTGRFNFQVNVIELVGEGALKKAYDQLKEKLTAEGLFDIEKKKDIPELVQKIGLITSETGAVIHDFLNNIGKFGFKIKFFNSRVEGQLAITDLLRGIKFFENEDIDVLIIIRGGGSLESLQAFNNEVLVRKIADFKKPVICGIGHDKDVPLCALAADLLVSTPTAVTVVLNRPWDDLIKNLSNYQKELLAEYQKVLRNNRYLVETFSEKMFRAFDIMRNYFESLRNRTKNYLLKVEYAIKDNKYLLREGFRMVLDKMTETIRGKTKVLENIDNNLKLSDPKRQLKLGYSIVKKQGMILKSKNQAKIGDELEVVVMDGIINTKINKIN